MTKGFWGYDAPAPPATPPADLIAAGWTVAQWESLSPGMRREIARQQDAQRDRAAQEQSKRPEVALPASPHDTALSERLAACQRDYLLGELARMRAARELEPLHAPGDRGTAMQRVAWGALNLHPLTAAEVRERIRWAARAILTLPVDYAPGSPRVTVAVSLLNLPESVK